MLEMIPGAMVWATFAIAIILSFVQPLWAVYFIVVFDLYWLLRVLYWLVYLLVSNRLLRRSLRIDWKRKAEALPRYHEMYHVLFLPFATESLDVLRSTFLSLRDITFPRSRLIIVLGAEERMGDDAQQKSDALQREFGSEYYRFLQTTHPANIAGEMIGKGSNLNWMGHQFKKLVDDVLHIPYGRIIVSAFDVDTHPHPQYFCHLTYVFLTHPDPLHTSFQPLALYNNNIWKSPAFVRVAANSTTFWLMTEQMRPDRLFTFSSHSMSFPALVDVGFWQSDIVTEDSRIFLQGFLRYDGHYTVTPMYMTVSMYTPRGDTLWASLRNLYKQQRRWAYGVENFPFMAWNFARNPIIPFHTKFRYLWNQLEGIYSWATAPIVMFVLGRLPLVVNRPRLGNSILAQNAPLIINSFMLFAMIGIIVSAALSLTLLPPRPANTPRWHYATILLQWVFLPISLIVFGAFPATDAQTHLLFGRYLGFYVSEKRR